jgi:hypothetical protein
MKSRAAQKCLEGVLLCMSDYFTVDKGSHPEKYLMAGMNGLSHLLFVKNIATFPASLDI